MRPGTSGRRRRRRGIDGRPARTDSCGVGESSPPAGGRSAGPAARVGASLGRSALVEPFRSPAYRSFWLGNALVQAGDQLQIVALAILALDLSRSPATLGLILAAQAIP